MPRLLIVEDHPETQYLLEMLFSEDFRLDVASGAFEALDMATDVDYDVFLIDISLRDSIDGVEVAQRLREDERFRQKPMIAMTALLMENGGDELLERGFDHFVQKPFNPEDIVELVEGITSPERTPSRRLR